MQAKHSYKYQEYLRTNNNISVCSNFFCLCQHFNESTFGICYYITILKQQTKTTRQRKFRFCISSIHFIALTASWSEVLRLRYKWYLLTLNVYTYVYFWILTRCIDRDNLYSCFCKAAKTTSHFVLYLKSFWYFHKWSSSDTSI